jgi:regulatory protein
MATRGKPKKLDAEGLWQYALRALGMRAHSVNELRQKLARRADSPAAVTETMDKLGDYGLTDDAKFSESLAAARLQNKGFGRFRVLNELRSKRVALSVAESAINIAYAGAEEGELIKKFLDRKYRGKDLATFLKDPKNTGSVYRRLRLAGFSSAGSLSALKAYSTQIDELSPPPDDELT